jgi:hypothetical protein
MADRKGTLDKAFIGTDNYEVEAGVNAMMREASKDYAQKRKENKMLAKFAEKFAKAGKQRVLNEHIQEKKRFRPSGDTLKAMNAVVKDVEATERDRQWARMFQDVHKTALHHELVNTERAKLQEETR